MRLTTGELSFNLIDKWVYGGGRHSKAIENLSSLSLCVCSNFMVELLPADASRTPRSVLGRKSSWPHTLLQENEVSSSKYGTVINLINKHCTVMKLRMSHVADFFNFRWAFECSFSMTFNCLDVYLSSCREIQFIHQGCNLGFLGCWRYEQMEITLIWKLMAPGVCLKGMEKSFSLVYFAMKFD